MKTLNDYTEVATSKLLKKHGSFFAFSDKQFNEQKKDDVKYVSLGMGWIVPKENAKQLIKEYGALQRAGRAQDLKENGKEAVIKRELNNFECFYTMDITDAVDRLKAYAITKDEVRKVFDKLNK